MDVLKLKPLPFEEKANIFIKHTQVIINEAPEKYKEVLHTQAYHALRYHKAVEAGATEMLHNIRSENHEALKKAFADPEFDKDLLNELTQKVFLEELDCLN